MLNARFPDRLDDKQFMLADQLDLGWRAAPVPAIYEKNQVVAERADIGVG